jgi:hypothetical protein
MADIGNGTSVTFGTSSFSASLMSVTWGGITRPAIQTSHLGTTTAHTFMPDDLYDGGDITLSIQYNPNTQPPISGAAETVTVTYPVPSGSSNGATHAFSGFVTEFVPGNAGLGELMIASVTVKVSGAITYVDAS